MLVVRDAEGLRDKAISISNNLREISTEMYSGILSEGTVRGLLMVAAKEIDSTINEFVEVESERDNSDK